MAVGNQWRRMYTRVTGLDSMDDDGKLVGKWIKWTLFLYQILLSLQFTRRIKEVTNNPFLFSVSLLHTQTLEQHWVLRSLADYSEEQ